MHITKDAGGVLYNYIVPVKCKCWECPTCRKRKALQVAKFIRQHFDKRKLWMLTFTDPHRGDVLDAWKTMGDKWNRLRTWVTKEYGVFAYIRVIEPHKKGGWPHMHVLVDKPVAQTKMVKMITRWGFGWNFSSVRVSTNHAAFYVTKYLTKEWPDEKVQYLRSQSKCRIVQASHGLGPIFFVKSEWCCENYNVDGTKIDQIARDIFLDEMARGVLPVIFEISNNTYLIKSRSRESEEGDIVPIKKDVEMYHKNTRDKDSDRGGKNQTVLTLTA